MSVILQLRGQLVTKKQEKLSLISSGSAKVEAIREMLATAAITQFSELPLEQVATLAGEAYETQQRLQDVLAEIAKIEKELGR